MNTSLIIRKAWSYIWTYKVLWFFGLILALTTANSYIFNYNYSQSNASRHIPIYLNDDITIYLPGEGVELNFADPEGEFLKFDQFEFPYVLRGFDGTFFEVTNADLLSIVLFALIWLLIFFITFSILRYVSETAIIRLVNEAEDGAARLRFGKAFRKGWSRPAFRVFLIDLMVGLVFFIFIGAGLVMVLGPISLIVSQSVPSMILALTGITVFLVVAGFAMTILWAVLSLVIQNVRRACIIDDFGVFRAIREGFRLLRVHFQQVGLIWLVWVAARIVWAVIGIVLIIVLSPLILGFLLVGFFLAGVPALITTGVASIFTGGIMPWIYGAVVGFPIMFLVAMLPMAVVSGWIEIFKSNLWTLEYRALKTLELVVEPVVADTELSQPPVAAS